VVPFLVMVDPVQCGDVDEFDITNPEKYNYFVIGESHSAEARRQLIKEHPTTINKGTSNDLFLQVCRMKNLCWSICR
jgi:hypothetical protein